MNKTRKTRKNRNAKIAFVELKPRTLPVAYQIRDIKVNSSMDIHHKMFSNEFAKQNYNARSFT